MAATYLKNVRMGGTKVWKVPGSKRKQLEDHFTANYLIGKRSIT